MSFILKLRLIIVAKIVHLSEDFVCDALFLTRVFRYSNIFNARLISANLWVAIKLKEAGSLTSCSNALVDLYLF